MPTRKRFFQSVPGFRGGLGINLAAVFPSGASSIIDLAWKRLSLYFVSLRTGVGWAWSGLEMGMERRLFRRKDRSFSVIPKFNNLQRRETATSCQLE